MQLFSSTSSNHGPMLIGAGILLVGLAQLLPGMPMVTPIAIVGWGSLVTLHAKPRTNQQDAISMVNLTIYSSLVCMAVLAQSLAVIKQGTDYVNPAMLCDHAAAIVLMLGLAANVVQRLSEPLAEES